jgi:two-component system sensor histidine kinase UhpB
MAHQTSAQRVSGSTLLRRVFITNAAVLVAAVAALAFTPATVSSPIALREAVVLVAGLSLMLVMNLFLMRRAFAPLARLTDFMRRIDPLAPGERVRIEPAPEREVKELASAFNNLLDRLENERRESARRALAAQERERRRLARELHDELGQTLTAVLLQLTSAVKQLPPDRVDELLEAQETTRAGLEEVRRIARELRPDALDDFGLESALKSLSDRVSAGSDVRVIERFDPELPALSPEAELVLYRVAQESLTNVIRHADASEVELVLARRDGGVTLRVVDDGRGMDGAEWGTGIRGMRERAILVGGRLTIAARATRGSEVRLDIDPREADGRPA